MLAARHPGAGLGAAGPAQAAVPAARRRARHGRLAHAGQDHRRAQGGGRRAAARAQGEPGGAAQGGAAGGRSGARAGASWSRAGPNSPLLRRIAGIRRQMAADLGYLLPPVKVADNLSLRAMEYVILLKGAEIGRYEMPQGCELAIPSGQPAAPPDGAAHARAGLRPAGLVDPARARRAGAPGGLHGGGPGERARHAPGRIGAAVRPRAVLAAGRQETARPRGGGERQGGGGPGAQAAAARHRAARAAEPAARARARSATRSRSSRRWARPAPPRATPCCSPNTCARRSGAWW